MRGFEMRTCWSWLAASYGHVGRRKEQGHRLTIALHRRDTIRCVESANVLSDLNPERGRIASSQTKRNIGGCSCGFERWICKLVYSDIGVTFIIKV